jgi:7,8-dihydropterin-6-yl-methyl-4-(beta-D-ribofuranosyl)aminobenzene 5'-phosphate synthase
MNKKIKMALILVSIILLLIVSAATFLLVKASQVNAGREEINAILDKTAYPKLANVGYVKRVTVLPVIDFYSDDKNHQTEPGVSYLVKADNTAILMDVGYNMKGLHPSALIQNMNALNLKPEDINMIFISHVHPDHVGGISESRKGEFSLSRGPVKLGAIPVYAPGPHKPSRWNPGPRVIEVYEPRVIALGIASLGVIPRFLFLFGRTDEQVLAINLKGKGIVLIIGCGHPSIERIIERTKMLFNEPIYAIIGGLHFPVKGGRGNIGPVNIQYIVGADRAPWNGLNEQDVEIAIKMIQNEKVSVISVSSHDSSDWSLEKFKQAFPNIWRDLKVGKEITL